ncbi:MAG: hypothetical protein N2C14_03595 [Planctomycetales bacterium]
MLIALLVALGAHRAWAAEATGMEILQDGEHVAGFTITHMGQSEAEIWLLLKEIPLTFERDFSIPVDPNDDAKATLTGSLEIRTHRRGDAGTGTVTDHVDLVRRGASDWHMTDAEVDRTLKATGLKPPTKTATPRSAPTSLFMVLPLGVIGLVIVIAFLAFVMGRGTIQENAK